MVFKKILKCDIRFSTYHWYRGEQVADSLECDQLHGHVAGGLAGVVIHQGVTLCAQTLV